MRNDTNGLFSVLALTLALSVIGCTQQSEAPATARKSQFKPEFNVTSDANDATIDVASPKVNGPLQYLNRDHFGCLKLSMANLKATKELNAIPWNDLDETLSQLTGNGLAADKIKAIYLIMDSQFLKFEDFSACLGFLVETRDEAASELKDLDVEGQEDDENRRMILDSNLVAYGPSELLQKLQANPNNESLVALQMEKMNNGESVTGVFSIRPIRSALKGIFSLFALQPELQVFSELPDDIQEIAFSLKLDSEEEFFHLEMDISNAELKKKIVQSINQSMANQVDLPDSSAQIPGLPESMIPSETPNVLISMTGEVLNSGLLTVTDTEQKLKVNLEKPGQLQELVSSLIADYAEQTKLARRLNHAKLLATALQKYYDEYGVLPPSGPVAPGGDLPAQFNWRTGLLSQIGFAELSGQFDFSRPWNDEVNLNVGKKIEAAASEQGNELPFLAFDLVRGPNRIYQDLTTSPKLSQISDRKIWTAICVESGEPVADWMAAPESFQSTESSKLGLENETGILTITASFGVRILKKETDKIDAFMTISGDEKFGRNDFLSVPQLD